MLDERTPNTTAWMLAILAVAVLLVAIGLGWMAFGPPLT